MRSFTHSHRYTHSIIMILMDGVSHIHNNTLITMNKIVHSLTQIHTQYHHDPDGWPGVPHIHNNTLILMNEIVHSLTQIHTVAS
jgi:hypothetical protein